MKKRSALTLITLVLAMILAAGAVRADFWDDDAYKQQPQQQQKKPDEKPGRKGGNTLTVIVVMPANVGSPADLGWAPCEGAEVSILGTEYRNLTDPNGMVRFDGLPDGNYNVTATKVGLGQVSRTVTVKGPIPTNIDMRLSPGSTAFEERITVAPDTCYIAYAANLPSLPPGATQAGSSYPHSTTPGVVNPYGVPGPSGQPSYPVQPGGTMPGGQPVDTTRPTKGALNTGADPFTVGGGVNPPLTESVPNPFTYTPNFGTNLNNLMLVDPQDVNKIGWIPLAAKPYWLKFNAAGTKLYVAVEGQQIQVYDILSNNVLLGAITVPEGFVSDMVISPQTGDYLYASIVGARDSSVMVISTSTNSHVKSIPLQMTGGRPGKARALAISPDGGRLFAAMGDTNSGEVVSIDLYNQRELGRAEVGAQPLGLAISPDGMTLFVSCSNANRIHVLGTSRLAQIKTPISVGVKPMRCALSPDGSKLYVCCFGSGGVAVIDARTCKMMTLVSTGAGPMDVAVSSDGRKVYVTNKTAATATLIDGDTNMVVKSSQPIPNCVPYGVAVKP
jgi:YVTN family beta-propeller protein